MKLQYLRYAPEIEVVAPNEAALTSDILKEMAATSQRTFDLRRHAFRDAFAKSHGFLKGELSVPRDLPGHLRQGVFSRAATYQVVVRLSSGPGDVVSDTIPASRGMAIKLIGVDGVRLLPDHTGHNQDFVLINIPVFALGTLPLYKDGINTGNKIGGSPAFVQRAIAAVACGVEAAEEAVGVEPSAVVQQLARDNANLLGETYHSAAPIRFGVHMAKISAAPLSPNVKALTGKGIDDVGDSTMRDLVVEHFRHEGAEYQLRAQLCVDLDRMPIEDATVLWPEELSPHQPVATLRIPAQEAFSSARRVFGDDVLSFSPWNGIEEHRPLGAIMRVRRSVYEQSSRFRHDMNVQPRIEPAAIGDIPD
ncbi:catalase family protein [Bradyrhizobium sp. Ai1a-2]|uniref:catalase family protein n=1 Tax=Bradyrhizobium sp. Ai1a-2 TaxID=196490 RepID=UPI0003F550F9|nr:catalase family protein [Bradyrhizobium sp. Ai1a-2]